MELTEYQKLAARTMKPRRDLTTDLLDYLLGIGGEVGELQNAVKKMLYHQHDWDADKIEEELGDILWYLSSLANILGYSLNEIAEKNIEKLRKRYPGGYSHEASRNRVV